MPVTMGRVEDMASAPTEEGEGGEGSTTALGQDKHVSHDVGGDTITLGSATGVEASPKKRGRPRKS